MTKFSGADRRRWTVNTSPSYSNWPSSGRKLMTFLYALQSGQIWVRQAAATRTVHADSCAVYLTPVDRPRQPGEAERGVMHNLQYLCTSLSFVGMFVAECDAWEYETVIHAHRHDYCPWNRDGGMLLQELAMHRVLIQLTDSRHDASSIPRG